jgi:hypothetical protein
MTNYPVSQPYGPARRSPVAWWRGNRLLLALFTTAGVISVLKGLDPHLTELRQFYWYLSYSHGLVRRALLGALFHPLLRFGDVTHLATVVTAMHLTAMAAIVGMMFALYDRALAREESGDSRITLSAAYLCLMCSPWLSTFAHDVGTGMSTSPRSFSAA